MTGIVAFYRTIAASPEKSAAALKSQRALVEAANEPTCQVIKEFIAVDIEGRDEVFIAAAEHAIAETAILSIATLEPIDDEEPFNLEKNRKLLMKEFLIIQNIGSWSDDLWDAL